MALTSDNEEAEATDNGGTYAYGTCGTCGSCRGGAHAARRTPHAALALVTTDCGQAEASVAVARCCHLPAQVYTALLLVAASRLATVCPHCTLHTACCTLHSALCTLHSALHLDR